MSDPTALNELTRRLVGLAGRLADLIEGTCPGVDDGTDAATFLRAWARAQPAADEPDANTLLERLRRRMSLSEPEVELVVLAGMPDEHEGLAGTFRSLHPRGEPRPTVGLATHLVSGPPDPERMLREGLAVRHAVLHVIGDAPFHERSLLLADQLWGALRGHSVRLDGVEPVHVDPPPPGLDGWLARPSVNEAVRALTNERRRILLVLAEEEAVGLSRCAALLRAAGLPAVAGRCAPDDGRALGLLSVHAAVRGGIPVLVATEHPEGTPPPALDVSRVIGPVLVCARPGTVRLRGTDPVLNVPIGPIAGADRRAAWAAALPGEGNDASAVAARHVLDPALTAQVGIDLTSRAALRQGVEHEAGPDEAEIAAAIRARAGVALPAGVALTTPSAGWERLVLAHEAEEQLRDAAARLTHQARVLDEWGLAEHARADRGVRLLLTGPPGTGKSLAAEVVASAAGTDLLAVDVARVVSKWIGETEKNLAAAFDVAERTQVVLFLDEADALFGARTEISDAHDRYANLETAYLLQRLDRFEGLAVLATNLRQNIDPAFIRRMDFVIDFELPDEPSRRQLWDLHLPEVARGEDVDLQQLAHRYPVPGGWIRNAVIAAAFLAADEDVRVQQRHLLAALRREYDKAGRSFPTTPVGRGRTTAIRAQQPDLRAQQAIAAAASTSASPTRMKELT